MFSKHWILLPSLGAVILVELLCRQAYTGTQSISIPWTWIIASHPGAPSTTQEEDKGVNMSLPAASIAYCSPGAAGRLLCRSKETREDDDGYHRPPGSACCLGRLPWLEGATASIPLFSAPFPHHFPQLHLQVPAPHPWFCLTRHCLHVVIKKAV